MSLQQNTTLMERAKELLEELDSHPSGIHRGIDAALKSGDLDELRHQVSKGEAILSEAHFYENNMIDQSDEY